MSDNIQNEIVVLISADFEWLIAKEYFSPVDLCSTPYGECFLQNINGQSAVFLHGGWGKVAAAGSTQYAIDRWNPGLIVNLGTCGGFDGCVQKGEIILATDTLIYDIDEKMGNSQEALESYATRLDLSWLSQDDPQTVRRARLISADRDISPAEIKILKDRFGAVAADWESGAIAWVTTRNHLRCLILRGVSDLVNEMGGEAYGNPEVFFRGTKQIMYCLLKYLPEWLNQIV